MRRREFIKLLAGSAAAWPLAVRAQQPERMRRIGVIISLATADPKSQQRKIAFEQGLQELGWRYGRNVRIEYRWGAGDASDVRKYAAELLALAPDVIVVSGGSVVGPLLQLTHTVPVVFTRTPIRSVPVLSTAWRGRAVTSLGSQIPPTIAKTENARAAQRDRAARDASGGPSRPASPQRTGQWGAVQAAAPAVRVEVSPVNVRNADEIERGVTAFARSPNGGLIVPGSALVVVHRKLIIELAARHKLSAVYPIRPFATDGGLISYGADANDPHRRAASYVDRILKGKSRATCRCRLQPVSTGNQSQDCQGAWHPSAAHAARARRRGHRVRRRDFIKLLGGAAATWSPAASAEHMRCR